MTMITEFIGMTAALSIFGVSPIITVLICWGIMGFMVLQGHYWTWEKLALLFCAINMIYIPAAFFIHPSVKEVLHGFIPHLPPGGFTSSLFFLLMANIGTTIAPWMIFFQQSTVVDKGMKEKDILWGKLDTLAGSILTVAAALFVIIVTGKVLFGKDIESAAQAAIALMPINKYVGTLVAIGLFDAGLLGAVCISLASSWAFGEVFGWAHSLNHKVREAKWFYAYYFFDLVLAGTITLIPRAPLVLITLFVQVAATVLLPTALVFLIILLNNEEQMGKYKNSRFENIINISIVIALIVISTGYSLTVVFPHMLR
jgi:Mn2+/Fe2+ NRAMP family transporter